MKLDLEPVDALKGLAALLIAFFHWSAYTIWADAIWLSHLWLMVDLLFVITGFVLAGVYRDRMHRVGDIGVFAVLRLVRIYPIHLFFILPLAGIEVMKQLYLGLGISGDGTAGFAAAHLSASGLWAHLSLTQAFGWHAAPGWNQPAWYAAVEFWIAIMFALACLAGLMRNIWGRSLLALVAMGALVWMVGS
ncbi:MAG: acyltransferase family protein, partial [Pikeienuella sp.]